MKKFDRILKEIAEGVRQEMRESIQSGYGWLSYEYDLSDCTVMIESHEVLCVNGLCISDYDVWIERKDSTHDSTLVCRAIRQVLPEWCDVAREIDNEKMMEGSHIMY